MMSPRFSDLNEIKVRLGLTIVRSETLGKYFVRETLTPIEELPVETLAEIEPFLVASNKRKKGA